MKLSGQHSPKKKFRTQYYTMETVNSLMNYAAGMLSIKQINAYVAKDNGASQALLNKMGCRNVTGAYRYADEYDYYQREMP